MEIYQLLIVKIESIWLTVSCLNKHKILKNKNFSWQNMSNELWLISGTGTANSQAITSTINKARYFWQHANIFRSIVFTGDSEYVKCVRGWGACDVTTGNEIRNGCYF
jgi:hypothetical protein